MSLTNLRVLSEQLQLHYDEMAAQFSSFQQSSGLTCLSGCGACCLLPTIEASPFEMLPLALELYDQGLADETLAALSEHSTPSCFFYKPLSADGSKGQCGVYAQRPTLCRVFGAGALSGSKLSICRLIKQEHPALAKSLDPHSAPRIDHWKQKAKTIASELSAEDLPINHALKLALEKVTMLAYYEDQQEGYRDWKLERTNNDSSSFFKNDPKM
jgi:uncharacterized protein